MQSMIIPDINLLIYAHDADSPHHEAAKAWWRESVIGPQLVGLPWLVVLGFVRLTSNVAMYRNATSPSGALAIAAAWLDYPTVNVLEPGRQHLAILGKLLKSNDAGTKLVNDAHLAALAIEHRATLFTHDRDFERFSGLKLAYPLRKR